MYCSIPRQPCRSDYLSSRRADTPASPIRRSASPRHSHGQGDVSCSLTGTSLRQPCMRPSVCRCDPDLPTSSPMRRVLAVHLPSSPRGIRNLIVVPAGDRSGSDDALGRPGLPAALDAIVAEAWPDVLIVDGGALTDATRTSRLLAHYLSHTVLVVTGQTRGRTLRSIATTLTTSGTEIARCRLQSAWHDPTVRVARRKGEPSAFPRP